uniref:RING-type E3 ubiquitin transferase n=1 Tax=Caenorhabditis japonica TaxID=281687 RepID=A0A8R1HUZ7_CAEJA
MDVEHPRPPDDVGDTNSGDVQNTSDEQPSTSTEMNNQSGVSSEPIDDNDDHLMCRVCRGNDGSLYYPCLCTGSIKYVHQECLVEWLKYSKKEVCELCNHKYSFQPIYRPDMPKALPIVEILKGVCISAAQMLKTWLVYTFVMATWLGLVPLTAARIYNCIFYMSFHDIVMAPLTVFKVENWFNDILKGSLLLVVFVCTFISLVWLREQIVIGGPPHFLNIDVAVDGEDVPLRAGRGNGNENEDSDEEEEEEEEEEDDDDDEEDEDDDEEDEEVEESDSNVPEAGEFFEPVSDGPTEPVVYIDNDEFLTHREAVARGHPGALAHEERRRDIYEARHGFRPRMPDGGPPYDDMRDDDNEIVENDIERRNREAPPPPPPQAHQEDHDRIPPPMEPEPIVPRAAARANRRIRRDRQDAEMLEQAADQDDNWRDWDRFGDELTWQRLLGLDGSLIFLEHVFWVISLNTLFTVTFAYIPYRFGNWLLGIIGLHGKIAYFPSIVAMLFGYIQIAVITFSLHQLMRSFKFKPMYRFFGVMFLIIKVFLLVFLEIGFFPVMCGCWMDVCTLPLFNVSLSQRIATFATAPFMSIFLHWMVGMVYVFYSASFVILLREILRPGVLWFMRNLNDPDFNPIQEMIDLPFSRHFRRLVVSTTLFFSTILLIFYIPLNIIAATIPTLLPYNVSLSSETPLSELSLELLILQVIMPAILEHANGRTFIKVGVRLWCKIVGNALSLDQYLLSDNNNNQNQNQNQNAGNAAGGGAGGGLAAEHQALLLLREPRAFEPYERPSLFSFRVSILLVLMSVTTTLCSVVLFILPAAIGRFLIYVAIHQTNVHEIYTIGIGLYVMWLLGKAAAIVFKFVNGGPHLFKRAVMHYSYLVGDTVYQSGKLCNIFSTGKAPLKITAGAYLVLSPSTPQRSYF